MIKKIKKIPHFTQITIIILIIILLPAIITLAKFIANDLHDYYLGSKNFYFTSNRLKEENPLYQVNNWSGVGTFDITFDLLSEQNNYVAADYDIPYEIKVTCDENVECNLNKETGIILESTNKDTITINVTPKKTFEENDKTRIHIEATSMAPYIKKISADFEYIVGKKGITFSIDDELNKTYALFRVTNAVTYCEVIEAFSRYSVGDLIDINDFKKFSQEDKNKCVSNYINLIFDPEVLLLDTTSSIIKKAKMEVKTINGVDYVNQLTFPIDALSSEEIRFYKLDPTKDFTYPDNNQESIIKITIIEPGG